MAVRPRNRAASTGMIVKLTTIETNNATVKRQAQRLKELADDAAHERQRQEHENRGQRRADHRAADLAAGPIDRFVAGLALGQMP